MRTVIYEKRTSPCFPISVRPVASTLFQMRPFEGKVCPLLISSMDARPNSDDLNSAPTSYVMKLMMPALLRLLIAYCDTYFRI